ncbi:hypothetical protein Sjap_025834 [Stephania japonica]|uniref:Uncharacterized protein n=1 Tax=Stephania japonica TaxID=461633 RepID=A0AAP0HEI6_9MAGN
MGRVVGPIWKGKCGVCAFGSECRPEKDQFQELILGLELTGLPFLVALKPPIGVETIDEALPDGFKERVKSSWRLDSIEADSGA